MRDKTTRSAYLPGSAQQVSVAARLGAGPAAYASATVLGSRWIFPGYFAAAAARMLAHGSEHAVPFPAARRYFGQRLSLDLRPDLLRLRISDLVQSDSGTKWTGSWFLDGGDWDGALQPVHASPIHREVWQVIRADLDFRATPAYQRFLAAAATAEPMSRNGVVLRTRERIDGYFQYCVDLIGSVRAHGILPRSNGAAGPTHFKRPSIRPFSVDYAERDIGIAIDADGELIRHLGGKHRTAIAQALRLKSIPVEVRLVHVAWLAAQMEASGLPAHLALLKGLEDIQARGFSDSPRTRAYLQRRRRRQKRRRQRLRAARVA
jgi:hypothetical protein